MRLGEQEEGGFEVCAHLPRLCNGAQSTVSNDEERESIGVPFLQLDWTAREGIIGSRMPKM
jgi:hypothetical protein